MRFDGFEFELEVFDVAFFALAEGSLTVREGLVLGGAFVKPGCGAYAARFCAFRLLRAGVVVPLSSSPSLLP